MRKTQSSFPDRWTTSSAKLNISNRMDDMKLPDIEKKTYFRKFDLFEKKAWRSTESFYKKNDQPKVLRKVDPFYITGRMNPTSTKIVHIPGKIQKRPVSCTPYWPTSVNRKIDFCNAKAEHTRIVNLHLDNEIKNLRQNHLRINDALERDVYKRNMMNAVSKFKDKMLTGLRELDTEYQILKMDTDTFTDELEDTKIRYHNITRRVAKLEKQSGITGNERLSVEKNFPLRQDTIEKTGLYYY